MARQDELRAALTAGGIPTDDDKVALRADRLRLLGHLYRARCGERNAAGGLADHLSVIGYAIFLVCDESTTVKRATLRFSRIRFREGFHIGLPAKTYKVTLPKGISEEKFWAFTVYDKQTHSMLDRLQRGPRGQQSYPSPAAERRRRPRRSISGRPSLGGPGGAIGSARVTPDMSPIAGRLIGEWRV